jgi:glycosyltransferase involved in cell wall biosynthesis
MSRPLEILTIEPYFGLSHRTFLEGYQRHSRHRVEIWSLPARKWKWRMRGSAFHFAAKARDAAESYQPDVVLASDFLNLADWRAIAPRRFREIPSVLYFHENQVSYPLADHAPVDHQYGWINLSSALAADRVLFNSSYHREQLLREVRRVLDRMPDSVPPALVDELRESSQVFPVGIDFTKHTPMRRGARSWGDEGPVLLWNHRWEYDKRPERFAEALEELARRRVPFRALICGESFDQQLPAFERLRESLGDRLLHLGFFPAQADYLRAVADADIVVSTACHEFFGISVVEAMYLGCLPVLPNDLAYPEIVPPHLHPLFLYEQDASLPDFLERFMDSPPLSYASELLDAVERFDWRRLAPELDELLERLAEEGPRS